MTIHPFIEQLSTTPVLWDVPAAPDINDPSWQVAWTKATNDTARRSLARGWVWSLLSRPDRAAAVDTFWRVMNDRYRWVQQIQPYLDAAFFAPHAQNSNWEQLSAILAVGMTPGDDDTQWLRDFFFGDTATQMAALQNDWPDTFPYDYYIACVGSALDTHAWTLAQKNPALEAAASRLSVDCGTYHNRTNRSLTGSSLPQRARVWYALGVYLTQGRSAQVADLLSLSDVRNAVCSMAPSLAAQVLLPSFSYHCNRSPVGYESMSPSSAFYTGSTDTDPYDVLARWIPAKKEMLHSARELGVSCLAALATIAAETPGAEMVSLPEDLSGPA